MMDGQWCSMAREGYTLIDNPSLEASEEIRVNYLDITLSPTGNIVKSAGEALDLTLQIDAPGDSKVSWTKDNTKLDKEPKFTKLTYSDSSHYVDDGWTVVQYGKRRQHNRQPRGGQGYGGFHGRMDRAPFTSLGRRDTVLYPQTNPLVEQHYTTEFLKYLKHVYKVKRVNGDCQLKNNVIIPPD